MDGVHIYGATGTWGTARTVSNVTLDPGNWSLDNFGEVLVATIFDGKTFTWNAGAAGLKSNPLELLTSTSGFNYIGIIQQLQE